ncbi:hypothetical protein GUJ93_ZPchr0003g17875 [Zizania palustris]|uniref:Uncharacterized protein n=1 Tax=Zizania palustris TaxID=103762 RepID=A0A8J5SKD3_ZIZPA|nr:hypothetical protein GUJ93_ZPchr0003g17116 [Zizania palustris]KAG8062098.1 hypothetical protein GUJ93_ZPchr0003g17875 [Zizania palustris]
MSGSGRPQATSSRSPFAAPNDYHRFPAPAPVTGGAGASISRGIGAGGVGGDIEEGLLIRTPVSDDELSIYSFSFGVLVPELLCGFSPPV